MLSNGGVRIWRSRNKPITYRIKFILLFLSFCAALSSYEYSLSLCAIFQNEAPYLKEWIDFHRKVGVEHFWLYNHLSNDNFKEVLRPYIENGIVELIEWHRPCNGYNEFIAIQCAAYTHAISHSKKKTKWLVMLDTDEFIYPVEKKNLIEFLHDYDQYASIGVNWQMFGTSHVEHISADESMLKKLVWKARVDLPVNLHVKCIVKPKYVSRYNNPHYPILRHGGKQVNADQIAFNGVRTSYCSIDKIRINHYWTRDEYFMMHNKLVRRTGWPGSKEWFLQQAALMNEVYDTTIHRFLD